MGTSRTELAPPRAAVIALAAAALLLVACSPPPEPPESAEQRQRRRSCIDQLVSECAYARGDGEAYTKCLTAGMRECADPR